MSPLCRRSGPALLEQGRGGHPGGRGHQRHPRDRELSPRGRRRSHGPGSRPEPRRGHAAGHRRASRRRGGGGRRTTMSSPGLCLRRRRPGDGGPLLGRGRPSPRRAPPQGASSISAGGLTTRARWGSHRAWTRCCPWAGRGGRGAGRRSEGRRRSTSWPSTADGDRSAGGCLPRAPPGRASGGGRWATAAPAPPLPDVGGVGVGRHPAIADSSASAGHPPLVGDLAVRHGSRRVAKSTELHEAGSGHVTPRRPGRPRPKATSRRASGTGGDGAPGPAPRARLPRQRRHEPGEHPRRPSTRGRSRARRRRARRPEGGARCQIASARASTEAAVGGDGWLRGRTHHPPQAEAAR